MPKKRIAATRKTQPISSFDFEDVELLTRVEQLAFDGYYDVEIADKLNVSRFELSREMSRNGKLAQVIESARARAREKGAEMPSPAKFAEVWAECKGKRTLLMNKFGIGWTKLQSWIAQEPMFADIMAERDLEFLEQLDIAGRLLALGGVDGKDEFPGWNRRPSEWMMRFYMNTTGKKYGYGENPEVKSAEEDSGIPTDVEKGIDIESWIKKEMEQKSNNTEAEQ